MDFVGLGFPVGACSVLVCEVYGGDRPDICFGSASFRSFVIYFKVVYGQQLMVILKLRSGKNKNSAIDKAPRIDDTFAPAQELNTCVAIAVTWVGGQHLSL